MRFGPVSVDDAEGAVLAHAVSVGSIRLKKAHRLSSGDVRDLREAGMATVIAAVLDGGDLGENEAAARVAASLGQAGIDIRAAATGRVNLHAAAAGVFTVDKTLVDAINAVDPAITLATLAAFAPVTAGQMVATVKIIPFAVPGAIVEAVVERARERPVLGVAAFQPMRVGLIQTERPGLKASVLDKTRAVTQNRLARSNSTIIAERRIPHQAAALAHSLRDLVGDCGLLLVFGASAVSDPRDVIPAAIRTARGSVHRVGMPVDPGNLLVLGELDNKPVIGAPGCARSPKENGFDWVLDRLLAGLDVTDVAIAGMGVGGLLAEIGARPAPRERTEHHADTSAAGSKAGVHAIILAAGRSSRMQGPNKLLALFEGVPLIRRVAERTLVSAVSGVTVVVGHQADLVRSALAELPLQVVDNPAFAEGLSTSLQTGIAAVPKEPSGAMIMLGDMPGVDSDDLARMLLAFDHSEETAIIRATHAGKRGNPVILPRASFSALADLHGDTGARVLVESGVYPTIDIELGEAASLDVDTPDALHAAGGVLTL